jgi:hypothetical protein
MIGELEPVPDTFPGVRNGVVCGEVDFVVFETVILYP